MNDDEYVISFIKSFNIIGKNLAALEYFDEKGSLGKPELMALESLLAAGGLTMGELSGYLNLSFSRTTGIIDRLIEKKLVCRQRSDSDRRVVKVAVTEKGKNTALAYQKHKYLMFERLTAALSPDEKEIFVTILEKIAADLDLKEGAKTR